MTDKKKVPDHVVEHDPDYQPVLHETNGDEPSHYAYEAKPYLDQVPDITNDFDLSTITDDTVAEELEECIRGGLALLDKLNTEAVKEELTRLQKEDQE